MKRNLLLTLMFVCLVIAASAQPVAVSKPVRVMTGERGLMCPVWSPDGTQIAVTTDNHKGIYVANADGSGMRCLTTADGAGYKMQWSADGKEILGRTSLRENGLVWHEVKTWQVSDGSETCLVSKTRSLRGVPTWNAAGEVRVATSTGRQLLGRSVRSASRVTENAYIIMVEDPAGATRRIASLQAYAGKMVINPALSPDGKKVVFQVPGYGMMVCGADGSNLMKLGKGMYPAWLPDSKSIIYTIIADDGQRFTAGSMHTMNVITGLSRVLMPQGDMIPMVPSVSADGKKVAFENEKDRSIYVVDLKY